MVAGVGGTTVSSADRYPAAAELAALVGPAGDDGGMNFAQPGRYEVSFPCRNPWCLEVSHPHPSCPHELLHQVIAPPYPPSVTAQRAAQQLRQLEQDGRLEPVQPLDLRWLWLVPPVVVIFFLLMLF